MRQGYSRNSYPSTNTIKWSFRLVAIYNASKSLLCTVVYLYECNKFNERKDSLIWVKWFLSCIGVGLDSLRNNACTSLLTSMIPSSPELLCISIRLSKRLSPSRFLSFIFFFSISIKHHVNPVQ